MNNREELFQRADNLVQAGNVQEGFNLLKEEIIRLTTPGEIVDLPISLQSKTEDAYGALIYQHYPNEWVAFNEQGKVLFHAEDEMDFIGMMEAKRKENPPIDFTSYMTVHTSQLAWLVYQDEQSSEDA
jgi:hypothetical protein